MRDLTPGWRLLALDSGIPNLVFSRGALGSKQLAGAQATIASVKADEALMVLCHYPCSLPPKVLSSWSHDLKEIGPLKEALAACRGRVVYVHGHIHKPWHVTPDAANGSPAFECINTGSPCMTSPRWPRGQGFWEIDLPEDPRGPLVARHHAPLPADAANDPDGTDPPPTGTETPIVRWRVGAEP